MRNCCVNLWPPPASHEVIEADRKLPVAIRATPPSGVARRPRVSPGSPSRVQYRVAKSADRFSTVELMELPVYQLPSKLLTANSCAASALVSKAKKRKTMSMSYDGTQLAYIFVTRVTAPIIGKKGLCYESNSDCTRAADSFWWERGILFWRPSGWGRDRRVVTRRSDRLASDGKACLSLTRAAAVQSRPKAIPST